MFAKKPKFEVQYNRKLKARRSAQGAFMAVARKQVQFVFDKNEMRQDANIQEKDAEKLYFYWSKFVDNGVPQKEAWDRVTKEHGKQVKKPADAQPPRGRKTEAGHVPRAAATPTVTPQEQSQVRSDSSQRHAGPTFFKSATPPAASGTQSFYTVETAPGRQPSQPQLHNAVPRSNAQPSFTKIFSPRQASPAPAQPRSASHNASQGTAPAPQRQEHHQPPPLVPQTGKKFKDMKNPYAVLGVAKTANPDDIEKAYRKKDLKHHPDKNGHVVTAVWNDVTEARDRLLNPKERDWYDKGAAMMKK